MFTWRSRIDFQRPELPIFLLQSLNLKSSVFKVLNNYSVTLSVSNVTLCPSVWENVLLQMVVRKTKEDRSVRETQPVVLPVKQKESLSYMNSREFTYIYSRCVSQENLCIKCERNKRCTICETRSTSVTQDIGGSLTRTTTFTKNVTEETQCNAKDFMKIVSQRMFFVSWPRYWSSAGLPFVRNAITFAARLPVCQCISSHRETSAYR